MTTLQIQLALLSLLFAYVESAPLLDASQVNSTTSSTPIYEQPWVASPGRRGTLDVLFSCLLTLILCVWTTVHTNIEPEIWQRGRIVQPEGGSERYSSLSQPEIKYGFASPASPPAGFGSHLPPPPPPPPPPPAPVKFGADLNKKKVLWSVVTLLFPEIALFVAAHERKTADLLLKEMETLTNYIGRWDKTLSYYAVMGGFVVEPGPSNNSVRSSTITESEKYGFTASSDAIFSVPSNITSPQIELNLEQLEKRCTLTPRGVLYLAQINQLPYPSTQTVKDKSKANLLAKFLICFQAIWMIIQVIGRYASKLPVTLLELYTVLHTFCAVAMYIIWIDKPLDITQPTFIKLSPEVLHDLITNKTEEGSYHNPTNIFWHHDYTDCLTTRAGLGKLLFRQLWDWHGFKNGNITENFLLLLGAYIALWNGWRNFWWEALALSFVGMVHGCLHLAAWDFNFPTSTERRLWKIASLLTAGAVSIFCFSVLIGFLGKLVWGKVRKKMDYARAEVGSLVTPRDGEVQYRSLSKSIRRWKHLTDWLESSRVTLIWWCMTIYCIGFVLAIVPCILARLYLLVESFVSMRQLPYNSYDKVVWASFLPHVG